MNKIKHVYLHINNKFYEDYTLYAQHAFNNSTEKMVAKWKNCISIDPETKRELKNIAQYTDATIFPKKNSSLYVAPGIPYPLDDIRRNYTIKRTPDTGDYNIISPLKSSSIGFFIKNSLAIFPERKEMVELSDWYSSVNERHTVYKQALIAIPDADYEEMVVETEDAHSYISMNILHDAIAYKMLLDKAFTKPCVAYTHLDVAGQNPLTLDALKLVYRFGSTSRFSKDAEENLILQLEALNQTAWRNYKGTINLLFIQMYRKSTTAFYKLITEPDSNLNKVVRNFKAEFSNVKAHLPFCSKEDFLLAQDYVKDVLTLGEGSKFVTIQSLYDKLYNNFIPLECFLQLFDNIIRISPKNEEGN